MSVAKQVITDNSQMMMPGASVGMSVTSTQAQSQQQQPPSMQMNMGGFGMSFQAPATALSSRHPHTLHYHSGVHGRICDVCRSSGHEFYQCKVMFNTRAGGAHMFSLQQCGYDLCPNCMSKTASLGGPAPVRISGFSSWNSLIPALQQTATVTTAGGAGAGISIGMLGQPKSSKHRHPLTLNTVRNRVLNCDVCKTSGHEWYQCTVSCLLAAIARVLISRAINERIAASTCAPSAWRKLPRR